MSSGASQRDHAQAGTPNEPTGTRHHGPGAVAEFVGDVALTGARTFGGFVLQVLSIAALLVLGAAGVGAGLWFGMGWLAIAGGVLIAVALLWALVIGFILFATSW